MKMDDQYMWESLTASPVSITVTESDNVGYGCLMVFLDDESASEIRTFARDNIPEEFLDEFGFEDEPHITCQYGFHGSVTVDEITEFIQTIDTPIKVTLGDITRFTQDAYDVIKMDIISKDLHDLSDKIRKHFKETLEVAFPEYCPHMTLAYVKKGKLPYINANNMCQGKNYVFDEFVYSTPNMEEKYDIKKNT
jgi:2'-5' RNA ligase